jgi:hypothetical protein
MRGNCCREPKKLKKIGEAEAHAAALQRWSPDSYANGGTLGNFG